MKCASVLLLLATFGGIWRFGRATCVLESDFGFVINCAFKKSGLFRVRNLGGIKAHVGLGFSVGDDLGFKDSFTNTDTSRRRSAQASQFTSQAALLQAQKANGNNITKRLTPQNTLPHPPQMVQKNTSVVPPFKPIPPAAERPNIPMKTPANTSRIVPAMTGVAVPAFSAMPASISRISQGPTVSIKSKTQPSDKMNSNFALRTLPTNQNSEFPPSLPQTNSNSISVPNITENALEAAIMQRQQLQKERLNAITSSTLKPYRYSTMGKVMNAPREYYPVGYDKNFDDNFSSRVELPETSFYCGDQKHFPGLYADEDLGCMVFHVCALTDDGLIMKSFLCPESTLFDQTILKCNWWFYVDCKNSKKLYDSNIPISKSYQLMKALTFFSSYKKEQPSTANKTTKATTKD